MTLSASLLPMPGSAARNTLIRYQNLAAKFEHRSVGSQALRDGVTREEAGLVHRGQAAQTMCPIAQSLEEIGDRWSLLIIRDALDGARRFSEFQRNLGVGRNVLSARLSKLVSLNVLRMQAASDGSMYREYVLTEKGESLRTVMFALRRWGEEFVLAPTDAHRT
ncbi:winged helix-turn-helix transcriptional regulator [Streptomyces sp. NPDC048171]|uniref:winged helix-turn-helix transcriptional regulator n=1 Tax=Streptomyces sp. NPDC048171 TaxID=3365504 RepID=UPI003714F255